MKLTVGSWAKNLQIFGALILICAPSFAAFEPLPMGGRAAGMSEAYTAIVDDVFSLYYNPAGVLQMDRPEIGSYYSRLFVGLSDNSEISRMFLGYAQPLGKGGAKGSFGVSYFALDLPGLYKEEGIGLTYGKEFKRLWNIGGSLKYLKKAIGSDEFTNNAINPITGSPTGSADPLLASGTEETGIALDLGLQYRLTRAYALGLAARNINSPDLALGSDGDKVPAVYTAALARRLRTGSLDIEVMQYKSATSNLRFSVGGEKWFQNGFALRAGAGVGSRNYSTVSGGASYKMENLQIDYATVFPLQGVEGTLGMQQVSLIVRLGKPPVDPLEKQLIHEKEERIRAETEARYAKAERDRLKRQLIELTQEKSAEEQKVEQQSAQEALKEAEAQQAATEVLGDTQEAQNQEIFNKYTTAVAEYNRRVGSGITLQEKKSLLEAIVNEFKDTEVNLSTVNREMRNIRVEEARAKKDFDLSMNFYRRLVQQGASADDRKGMLKRIIEKYKGAGINIQSAVDEMNTLEAQ